MEDFSHPSQRTQRKEEVVGARRMFWLLHIPSCMVLASAP